MTEIGATNAVKAEFGLPQPGEASTMVKTSNRMLLQATISDLIELQKQRVFCIKSQSRCDRSVEAFIARYLGYNNDLDAKERVALFKCASAIRKAVAKGGEGQKISDDHFGNALSACTPIIVNSAISRDIWDKHRAQTEKRQRALARSLPVWEFCDEIAGFGELGLAIIVGEAGRGENERGIADYATKERLWKRLGLAVIDGERQQKRTNAGEAATHGYNPRRRAEIWTLADSMFRHQWRGEKDGVAAHPIGRYGEIYAKRKAATESREWTKAHRESDARRVMMKALIEDLWKAWNST
jgi:hypothetical protein